MGYSPGGPLMVHTNCMLAKTPLKYINLVLREFYSASSSNEKTVKTRIAKLKFQTCLNHWNSYLDIVCYLLIVRY